MPAMSTYIVTQNASRFEVRVGDTNGRVVATFSNNLDAETFAVNRLCIEAKDGGAERRPRVWGRRSERADH
jgi:hypothetical protein